MKLCWIYRTAVSWLADCQNPEPAWINRHLRVCPECRRFQQDEQRLMAALRLGAEAQVPLPPPFLRGRITGALGRSPETAEQGNRLRRWMWAPLIPALALLTIGLYLVFKPAPAELAAIAPAAIEATTSEPVASEPFAKATSAQILAWTQRLDEPLRREFQFVVNDAAAALSSVTTSFLPDRAPANE